MVADQTARSHSAPELIAGRYRVEQRLAAGGMGEVFAVRDESTGRRLALKRLLAEDDVRTDERMASMFEREYHTLAGLKHPRIIEVCEYGVDRGRPYYTMELLDGEDLRKLAPLPYRRACRYLRDVASSLALLHARRLLHRDISPRNVRVTSDDRAKLIDFGALSSFGIVDVVVGTPPFVAPEAVQRTPLDQRADLFALGALSYWLLTGEQAFPARSIHELPELWRRPPRPPSLLLAQLGRSELDAIPQALDELVMSLLSPDPLGRPASAGEVIDRLSTLAGLPAEHEALSARSYLHGAPTVGRAREQAKLKKRLTQTLQGQGASVVLDAPPGMGGTRLLSELALEAQLAGAVSVMVDAELHREVYGVAQALVDKLLMAAPEEASDAARQHRSVLVRFSSRVAPVSTLVPAALHLPSGELRGRTQHALASFLCSLAAKRPLVIAIDNAHRCDEASAALLATLARLSRQHALLLVVARKPSQPASSPAAMRGIEEAGSSLQLRGLSHEEVETLVQALFGSAQNSARLAEWLHGLSGGNPQACMELVRHLVDTSVIRFKEGVWVLPQELSAAELPASVDTALDTRLGRLSADSLLLAEALCVHRGPLPIERCLGAAAAEHVQQPHAALEELAREEVLTQSGAAYHFAHETLRERMYSRLPPDRRRTLHRHFGNFLSKQRELDINAKLDAGWHLMHGGAEDAGAELLADAASLLVDNTDELAAAVPALAAALAVFRRQRRSKHALIRLLAPLAMGGYRVDRRLATEYGDETTAVFRELIGLRLADRLRPLLGRYLSLYLGLASGVLRALFVHGWHTPRKFEALITHFFTCTTMLAGTAAICLDAARVRRYARDVEPLTALGKQHPASMAYDFMCTLSRLPEDRHAEVTAGCLRALQRLENPQDRVHRQLPKDAVLLLRGGAYYALGAMAVFGDGPKALHWAERLESLGLQLYAMAAEQVRCLYHALRGELAQATMHRQRVETHAIQAGSAWQVEIWAPCGKTLVYTLTRDVIGIKGVVEELDRLRTEVPSLNYQHELARGVYLELKGEPELSYEIRRALLAATPARGYIGWPPTVGDQAATLIALGRPREAKLLAQSVLDTMTPEDEAYIAMYQRVYTSLSLAEATLGEFDAATQRLDTLIERHRPAAGPLTMGNLHAMRARVALMMSDLPEAQAQLLQAERWFRPTDNPALIAQCGRLRREVERVAQSTGRPSQQPGLDPLVRAAAEETETVRSVLSQCAGPEERAERALDLLVAHARATSGYLFFYQQELDRLSLVAPLHGDDVPAGVELAVLESIHAVREADAQQTAVVSESSTADGLPRASVQLDGVAYRIFPLLVTRRAETTVVGAVAVVESDTGVVALRAQVLEAVARSLFDAGDEERITLRPSRAKLGRA